MTTASRADAPPQAQLPRPALVSPLSEGLDDALHSVREALLDLTDAVEQGTTGQQPAEFAALRRALAGRCRSGDAQLLSSLLPGHVVVLRSDDTAHPLSAWPGEPGRAVAVAADQDVVALVAASPCQPVTDSFTPVKRAVATYRRYAPRLQAGVSTVVRSPEEVARAADEASRAAELSEPGRTTYADAVWFDIAISRLRDGLAASLETDGPLSAIRDPLRSGVDLRHTLITWLDADGDPRTAAERLHIHPNTLRYRLRRAAELTGLDLAHPLHRLVAYLALTSDT